MTNPARLATLLRFHLSELGSRNAHHEFEHLTRHIARNRIYSNILPATGPVSAGGDGGRDFETFRTSIHPLSYGGSRFAEHSSHERLVVFACSLEKRIENKIKSDLAAIVSGGEVDEVIYFCEANLPVSKRQRLIARGKALQIALQIFDGNAISELLAEPDLFWIAEEYLHVPAEAVPMVTPDDDYVKHKAIWVNRLVLPVSRADFVAIKSGLREATFDPDARPDLSFWLAKMGSFLTPQTPRDLMRSAIYEIAVGHLRGRGNLTSQEDLVTDYFSDIESYTSIGDLTNAVTLLTYAFGGYWLGHYEVAEARLFELRERLDNVIKTNFVEPLGPGRQAGLLYLQGLLEQAPAAPGKLPDFTSALDHGTRCWRQ